MPSATRRWINSLVAILAINAVSQAARGEDRLHARIDKAITSAKPNFEAEAAEVASDAEFLRRIRLDLGGTVPSADEARAFFNDKSADRRANVVDRLLASSQYSRHMANVFNVVFMDRRPDKYVKQAEWLEFLNASFTANMPYDQLVREVLSADGSDSKTRAAARFYLDRDAEAHLLTRDIGRVFLGMNLQCAQCHDHPLVDSYKQDHYYGLYAFLNRSFIFSDKAKKVTVLAEKGEGEVSYESVFVAKVTKRSGPRLPDGPPVMEPTFEKGKEYTVAPAKGVQPIPKYSRRSQLAGQVTSNVHFKRSAANRLWFMMLGRGIVHPVDFDHEENPPSHPELRNSLADEFAAHKFDIKYLLREIALSKTYQRSSELRKDGKNIRDKDFAVALLRPLSAEQFAWSLMQATGLVAAERKALGPKGTEAALDAKLYVNVAPFVAAFGGQPGQPADLGFQATVDQTLFLSNGDLIRGWLTPRPGNLTDTLMKLKDNGALAEELCLSVLTRLPTTQESAEVADFLQRAGDRSTAIQNLAWALLASAEFRFNH